MTMGGNRTAGKIIKWFSEKNIDLRASLRLGMYSNYTYFYDMITNRVSGYKYSLKNELGDKTLGKDAIPVSEFGDRISRVMFRMSDHGALEKGAGLDTSGRDHADMAKSFSRYNLLFTQAINKPKLANIRIMTNILFINNGINHRRLMCNNPECECENCTCDPCECSEDNPCGCN